MALPAPAPLTPARALDVADAPAEFAAVASRPGRAPLPSLHTLPVRPPEDIPFPTFRDLVAHPTSHQAIATLALVGLLALATYFPHRLPSVEMLMSWWWFRLACLLVVVGCAGTLAFPIADETSGRSAATTLAGLVRALVLVAGIVYTAATNVVHVRRAAASE